MMDTLWPLVLGALGGGIIGIVISGLLLRLIRPLLPKKPRRPRHYGDDTFSRRRSI